MPSSIQWTDGTGAATLANGLPAPLDRFRGWTPDAPLVKAESASLATGQPYPFVFRTDDVVSFTLPRIPNTSQALALRLIKWLGGGGVVTVNTGDAGSRVYSSCYLAPGATPRLSLADPVLLHYELALTLLAPSGGPLICVY